MVERSRLKIIQVTSLLLQKFSANTLIYPGAPFDPDGAFSPLRGPYMVQGNQSYSMGSASFAFLSSLPFFFLGYPGLYIIPFVSTLGVRWTCAQIGPRLFSQRWTLAAILICGLASPFFFYSVVFWEHTLTAFLAMLALWLTQVRLEQDRLQSAVTAGLLIGIGAWFRNEVLLAAPALGTSLSIIGVSRRSV